jgi:hypothetical protein
VRSEGRAAARVLVVTRVSAPEARVLIEDSAGGEPPVTIPGQLVASTASSIAVGCAASAVTEVAIADIALVPAGTTTAVYDGRIETPSRRIAVRTVLGATLLEVVVPSTKTELRIWANDPTEPTELTIGVARPGGVIAR